VTLEDVEAQVALALEVRNTFSDARFAAVTMEMALEARPGDQALMEINRQLVTEGGAYPQPMLLDQLEYLYENLLRADQKPGRDAYNRYEELKKALEELMQKLEQVLQKTGSNGGSR
jgi:hypothetical protein